MAKAKSASLDQDQVRALAEKLYVAHWPGPKSQFQSIHTVERCFEAAEEFVRYSPATTRAVRNTDTEQNTQETEG